MVEIRYEICRNHIQTTFAFGICVVAASGHRARPMATKHFQRRYDMSYRNNMACQCATKGEARQKPNKDTAHDIQNQSPCCSTLGPHAKMANFIYTFSRSIQKHLRRSHDYFAEVLATRMCVDPLRHVEAPQHRRGDRPTTKAPQSARLNTDTHALTQRTWKRLAHTHTDTSTDQDKQAHTRTRRTLHTHGAQKTDRLAHGFVSPYAARCNMQTSKSKHLFSLRDSAVV